MSAPTITTPGSRSSVRLSLIIATYNRADYLPRTLNSLTNQSLGSELFEIIVVNNNSTDHTGGSMPLLCRSSAGTQLYDGNRNPPGTFPCPQLRNKPRERGLFRHHRRR
ncbi:MAG: glycosyltransferase family 2 protein [Alistipes indistinctus]